MGTVRGGQAKPASWRVLARTIAGQLPAGFTHFSTEPTTSPASKRVSIVAHYPGTAPAIAPFAINARGDRRTVDVRTTATPVPLAAAAGGPPAYTGLYPGATIAADLGGGGREYGAVCAFLSATATDAQPTHLLTCGHMFPPGASGVSVFGGAGGAVIGTLVKNGLNGTSTMRDVALVALTAAGQQLATAGGAGPQLVDYLPQTQIFALGVQTYRPTTDGYSPMTQTASAVTSSAHVSATLWPNGFSISDVIATTSQISSPGDSGTILATPDPIAIGSCSASGGGQSLFEPIGRAIDDVFETAHLTLWRN